jgi:hypothetical protein
MCATAMLAGCVGSSDTATDNAPASKGQGGVPVLSPDQLAKLPADRQEQIQKDQDALQKAATQNQERKKTGQMPNGG